MKNLLLFFLVSVSCIGQGTISIIPKPEKVSLNGENFLINKDTKIIIPGGNEGLEGIAYDLMYKIRAVKHYETTVNTDITSLPNTILFSINPTLTYEAYNIEVNKDNIKIEASGNIGHFYGYQTLLQLLPADIYNASYKPNLKLEAIGCNIIDKPRFEYRGVMLDVSRYFFPKEFIKKLIDELAMHKINNLHWHLTDDQGWRIEIKKYPKLTEIGSIRKESMLGHYRDQKYDGIPHQGFYTQEDIREIVAYASKKYINVIPEIEMPGHALAAIAAYPELGCTGEQYAVGTKWGVEERVFCPKEKTFTFLEDVLTEVMALFPSKYIHIGGDECPKKTWEKSKFCQDLIKKEGLKDEHELQSYFIKRIDKFVSSKGRKIIGWDEILEGGLSPNATVMSWRGVEGGINAAKQKHDVIMSPNSYFYLDYYQSDPKTEPLAIGGLLTLEKSYSFEPISSKLKPEESKYIKGVQANLWTEYISTPEYAEYMLFPRAIALAEVGWSSTEKSYSDFLDRLIVHTERLDNMGINYSRALYEVKFISEKNSSNLPILALRSIHKNAHIRYTLDGSLPNEKSLKYDESIKITINGNRTIAAALFAESGKQLSKVTTKSYVISAATGKTYKAINLSTKYTGGEVLALTNGLKGDIYSTDNWVGIEGKNLNVVLDLGQKNSFEEVSVGFLGSYIQWVLPPKDIEVLISNDNKTFKSVKKIELGANDGKANFIQQMNIELGTQSARYIKIIASNYGALPKHHPGEGKPSWLFVDEISVR